MGGLHVVGFFLLIAVVAPHHYRLGDSGAFTIGIGLTAYTLGLRHAFDADHIAAIDNTTRKLMSEGKRPMSVGFFFSLGHSSVVFALAFLFAIGVRALGGPVTQPGVATAPHHRPRRHRRVGDVPVRDRDPEPDHSGRDRRSLPRHAPRQLRRGRPRAPAEHARLPEPHLRPLHPRDPAPVADVPARPALRHRVRYGQRGGAALPGRRRGGRRACRSTRSCACRSCSPPACRCSTRSTARS